MSKRSSTPTEAESMMASALLKIRADSSTARNSHRQIENKLQSAISTDDSGAVGSILVPSVAPDRRAAAVSAVTTPTLSSSSARRAFSGSANVTSALTPGDIAASFSLRHHTAQSIQPQHQLGSPFSPQQLSALQAAAAAGAASFAAAAAAANGNPIVELLARVSSLNASTGALLSPPRGVVAPSFPSVVSTKFPSVAINPAASSPHANDQSLPDRQNSNLNLTAEQIDSSHEYCPVRREQIEAALRSKPQRGRKRDNLNDVERLELTRTRNREHAKSTRIRKKARYQELVEREHKLRAFEDSRDLDRARRECVTQFISIRQRMLTSEPASDSSTSRDDETEKAGNVDSEVKNLNDIVLSLSTFLFDDENDENHEQGAVPRMQASDERLVSKVSSRFGAAAVPFLSYTVPGCSDGVALDMRDSGFVEVELAISSHPRTVLMTCLAKLTFVKGSDKLAAVKWHILQDYVDDGAVDRLNVQISYPSVVSLDPAAPVQSGPQFQASIKADADGETHREDDGHGPGMNI